MGSSLWLSVGHGAAHVQCDNPRTEARAEARNEGKEHSIPWRIKFLSCCIVDILTDDVTPSWVCRLQEIGSVPIGGSQARIRTQHTHNTQHTAHTSSRSLPLCYRSRVCMHKYCPPRREQEGKDCAY